MKNQYQFIKNKLHNHLLLESIKGGEYVMYHASDSTIQNFVDDFVGSREAEDLEGPGIYFSNLAEDAGQYGVNLHKVILQPRMLLDTKKPNFNKFAPIVDKLIKMKPEWEMNAQDWDENPQIGLRKFITSAFEANQTEKDLFQQVWFDFYRYSPVDYVRNMVKLGFDGLLVPRPSDTTTRYHIIVYNPSIIKIKS